MAQTPEPPTPAALAREWQRNLARKPQPSQSLGVALDRFLVTLAAPIPESVYPLLDLKINYFLKRQMLRRYYRSAQVFVWNQALRERWPDQAERVMDLFFQTLAAYPGQSQRRMQALRNDVAFFNLITDHYREEGFLSVALHIVQRILGEIKDKPKNLTNAVQFAAQLDTMHEEGLRVLENTEIGAL